MKQIIENRQQKEENSKKKIVNRKKIIISAFFLLVTIYYFLFTTNKIFELYAIKYGDSLFSSKKIFSDTNKEKKIPFSWFFYVLKIDKKIILIDTGFSDLKKIKKYNINLTDPIDLLKQNNISPEQITDIILTHSHFDHIGNIDKFKNANIYISKNELNYFLDKSSNTKIKNFFLLHDKLISFENELDLFNFIKIKEIKGHTPGSSVVFIKKKDKKYILPGDECYLIENCSKARPIGTIYDYEKNNNFIKAISNSNYEILTFHDPKIFDNYKRINKWTVKVE